MTTQEKHTPTPWEKGHANLIWRRYRDHKDRRVHQPVASCDIPAMLSDEEKAANAELIVRAVNAHDALVEALRGLLEMPPVCVADQEVIENIKRREKATAALILAGASNENVS